MDKGTKMTSSKLTLFDLLIVNFGHIQNMNLVCLGLSLNMLLAPHIFVILCNFTFHTVIMDNK